MMQTMTFSATAVGDVDLKYYVEEEIVPEFEKLTGVASVEVFGGQEDSISVQLIEEKMKQYHLNMSTVISMVPVSYTHLDVYKRQSRTAISLRGDMMTIE